MNYFSITYHSFLTLLLNILINFLVWAEKIQAQTNAKKITSSVIFFKQVDIAYYHAKDSGRNCMVDIDDLPAEGDLLAGGSK